MSSKEEYKVCQQRKHQKSNRSITDSQGTWDICSFCGTWFRYVTRLEEANAPEK